MNITHKTCNKCNIKKDISHFNKRKDSKDGYRNECIECKKETTRQRISLNKLKDKLEVIEDLGMEGRYRYYLVKCPKCEMPFKTRASLINQKKISGCQSCAAKTHDMTNTRIFGIWTSLIKRCTSPKSISYDNYGGRGITVYEEWKDFITFYNWAMSNGYNENLTIDRIDNDGNYKPSNCRWVDYCVQNANKGKTKRNTSGFKGVGYRKDRGHWTVNITTDNKTYHLGSSKCRLECAYKYDEFIRENNLPHPPNFK